MSDAATIPTTEPSTNGAGSRQQRLAASVKNLRTRQSLSSMPVDRWVLVAGAIMVPLGIALIILGWYGAIVDAVTGVAAGNPVTPAGRGAFAALRSSVEAVLDEDSCSSLVAAAATQAGGLTRAEVVSNTAVLMFGGIETTEGMIANAILHLLAHPEQRARVEGDRGLLPNAVEESLRLEPAAASIDRYATADVRLGDTSIGAGELVTISIAGANRDPDFFPDPDRFDVRRENVRHQIAFASGPHVCIGMHLARLEAHTAIRRLLDRLPGLRLDPERPTAPRGLVFRKPPALHVIWG